MREEIEAIGHRLAETSARDVGWKICSKNARVAAILNSAIQFVACSANQQMHQLFLFRRVLPVAATGAASCFVVAVAFLPPVALLAEAVFLGSGGFLVPDFVTIVVPALELLAPLVLPSASEAAPVRFACCRLGALVDLDAAAVWVEGTTFVGRAFSGDSVEGFSGDCGKVRELCDLGDSTPPGPAFREAVRGALELATTVAF